MKNDLALEFSKGVNMISGTNGTNKTSILHLISNAFKGATANSDNSNALKALKTLNACVNPKIETLTKGDKIYADPAKDTNGTLFSVEYTDSLILNFRRKNDKKLEDSKKRYRVIPSYKKGDSDKLPELPIVYLGLARLVPHGEIDDEQYKNKRDSLPDNYHKEIADQYKALSGIDIDVDTYKTHAFNSIKTRADFSTQNKSVDSNTISDGEDNLHTILRALVSLKYYFESVNSSGKENESILLIDEFDATLHPNLQHKLLKTCKAYSENYKIQIFFTTHNLEPVFNKT